VLGYLESFAREMKQKYHSEWVHVSTVRDGKITRWRGFANTAAPYGYLWRPMKNKRLEPTSKNSWNGPGVLGLRV
jgi:hypothetical protein